MAMQYGFFLSLLILLGGCAGLPINPVELPHGIGFGTCEEGSCSNGHGRLKAVDSDLSYEGHWREGRPHDGIFIIRYQGKTWHATYRNGVLEQGARFYRLTDSDSYDIYEGEWQVVADPFSGKDLVAPFRGTYTTGSGYRYEGIYYPIPTLGSAKGAYYQRPDQHFWPRLNLVFAGAIHFGERHETGIYIRPDLIVGLPWINNGGGFQPADNGVLERIQAAYFQELTEHEQRQADYRYERQRKSNSSNIDFGKLFAIAAGVALASQSGLDAENQVRFLNSYGRDVISGTTSNMQALNEEVHQESVQLQAELQQQLAEQRARQQQEILQQEAQQQEALQRLVQRSSTQLQSYSRDHLASAPQPTTNDVLSSSRQATMLPESPSAMSASSVASNLTSRAATLNPAKPDEGCYGPADERRGRGSCIEVVQAGFTENCDEGRKYVVRIRNSCEFRVVADVELETNSRYSSSGQLTMKPGATDAWNSCNATGEWSYEAWFSVRGGNDWYCKSNSSWTPEPF